MPDDSAPSGQPQPSQPQSPLARAKQIFLAVRALPLPRRDEELDTLCAGDAKLRTMVLALLAGDKAPLPFETLADNIVAARDAFAKRESEEGAGDAGHAGGAQTSRAADTSAGTRIGPYRVMEKIGEGGFGVVYMAEQEEPVRRRVALKILKLGMDTEQIVARFEAERQALAVMDHPAIARVFDAGATSSGRPYFVMELVRGEPITQYCDQRSLSIEDRLAIFRTVCEGVHHAHQKGVIHRDLKPDNILVAEIDGRPHPKIIDFGIAKAMSKRLTEKTVFTEFRQMIGTPEYMSPEQAERGHGDSDIDTRADVYSLGVILYEMLAGAPPFDPVRLRSAAYAEIQRIIREEDPPRPSARLSTLASLPSVAAHRTIDPTRLAPLLAGELDWVVMKCMDKDRVRRYGSAADLGADVSRYLTHQPVQARPASRGYLARKFVRRNRSLVAAGVIFTLLIGAGVAGTSIGLVSAMSANRKLDASLVDAREQRDLAVANEKRANTQLVRSEQLTKFLRSMLKSSNPSVSRDRDTTVLRELLDKALNRLDKGELKSEPIVEAEMRAAIAETYQSLGDNAASLRIIEPAAKLADAAPAAERSEYLSTRVTYASLLTEWHRFDEALVQLTFAEEAKAGTPEDDISVVIHTNYALLYGRIDEDEKGLEHQKKALAIQERLFGPDSRQVATTLGNIAGTLTDMKRHDEALETYQRVLKIYYAIEPPPLMHLVILENNYAGLLLNMGRHKEAEEVARRSLEKCERLFKGDHQHTATVTLGLGMALEGQGRTDEAIEAYRTAYEMLKRVYDKFHPFARIARGALLEQLLKKSEQDPTLYPEMERLAIEAYENFVQGKMGPAYERNSLKTVLQVYERWEKADPGKGHAEASLPWKAKFDAIPAPLPKPAAAKPADEKAAPDKPPQDKPPQDKPAEEKIAEKKGG